MSLFDVSIQPESVEKFKPYAISKEDRRVVMSGEMTVNVKVNSEFDFQIASKAVLIISNEQNKDSLSLSAELYPVAEWAVTDALADSIKAKDALFDLELHHNDLLENIDVEYFQKNKATLEQIYRSNLNNI